MIRLKMFDPDVDMAPPRFFDLLLTFSLEPYEGITSVSVGFDQFVQLSLQSCAVAILRRLQDGKKQQSHDAERQVCAIKEVVVAGNVSG